MHIFSLLHIWLVHCTLSLYHPAVSSSVSFQFLSLPTEQLCLPYSTAWESAAQPITTIFVQIKPWCRGAPIDCRVALDRMPRSDARGAVSHGVVAESSVRGAGWKLPCNSPSRVLGRAVGMDCLALCVAYWEGLCDFLCFSVLHI